jgi:hypothetical protein
MLRAAPSLTALLATLDRRVDLLDKVREALDELRAEGPSPCCHRGCAGCQGGRPATATEEPR